MPALSDAVLIDIIEQAWTILPEVPGLWEGVDFPGMEIRGRVTPYPHPFANSVYGARLTGDVAAALAAVRAFYQGRGLGFSWFVGPRTSPADLATHLAAAGLVRSPMAGMALRDISAASFRDVGVHVREVDSSSDTDAEILARLLAAGFHLPDAVGRLFAASYRSPDVRSRCYFASAPDSEKPEAFATMTYVPGRPVAVLSGAATLPKARGKGLYQALAARRLADARADGIEALVIQAMRATSAPILERRGFEEMCALELWIDTSGSERQSNHG